MDSLDNQDYNKALFDYLSPYVTDNKKQKFDIVLSNRTRHLTIVLEDVFKSHNASAVMRTAECMGIQDIHIVEQRNPFDYNPYVLRGSGKWLTLHRYNETENNMKVCLDQLKSEGYRVLATSPHEYAKDYRDFVIDSKTALIFGAEETGISDFAIENADDFVKIPMLGFTESFNISVSAAIILENFNQQIRNNISVDLAAAEIENLKLNWYKKTVPKIDVHLKEFNKMYHNPS